MVVQLNASQLTSTSASTEPPSLDENEGCSFASDQNDSEGLLVSKENEIKLETENSSYEMLENVETHYSEQGPALRARVQKKRQHIRQTKIRIPNILTVAVNESKCSICLAKRFSFQRSRIPAITKQDLWNSHRIWIPKGNRSCPCHIQSGVFKPEVKEILASKAKPGASLTPIEIGRLIHKLQDARTTVYIDLDKHNLDDFDFDLLFGVTKANFQNLLNSIKHHMRDSQNRSPSNALAIFLLKLRLGVSQRMTGFLFSLPQRKVGKIMWRVAELLHKHFCSNNLGVKHMSREQLIQTHDSAFVRSLYEVPDGKLVLFFDATYLYVEKSGNHCLQKKTFCIPKGRNLLKPMTITTSTGYMLDAAGLFFSDPKHNDASLLQEMFDDPAGIGSFVEPGDFFVVDRGFRDIEVFLESRGFVVKMPKLLQGTGRCQFTTEEANESRMVTFTRWVVEASHGRVKQVFKFFENVVPVQYYNKNCEKKLQRLWSICCAIVNKYRPPIFQDSAKHTKYLDEIKQRFNSRTDLKQEIETNRWNSIRKCWTTTAGKTLEGFPDISEDELDTLTIGNYQVKNAQAYVDDHLRLCSDFEVQLHNVQSGLLRVKMKARFRSSQVHQVYIEFSKTGASKIGRYYCTCKAGARTMGCCSHVASVVWFLGFKRNQSPDYHPKTFGTGILEITRFKIQDLSQPESEAEQSQSTKAAKPKRLASKNRK